MLDKDKFTSQVLSEIGITKGQLGVVTDEFYDDVVSFYSKAYPVSSTFLTSIFLKKNEVVMLLDVCIEEFSDDELLAVAPVSANIKPMNTENSLKVNIEVLRETGDKFTLATAFLRDRTNYKLFKRVE